MTPAKHRLLLLPLALSAFLAACGDDPPPPQAEEETAAVEDTTDAAPPPIAQPAPKRVAAPPPEAPPAVETTVTYPADAIGGTPVTSNRDARARANAALDKYLAEREIPRDLYYIKQAVRSGDGFEITAFGAYKGEGHYLTVRVHPEGHVDITTR